MRQRLLIAFPVRVCQSVGAIAPLLWVWVYNCNASAMYRLPYNNNNLRTVPKRALQNIMTRKKWSFSHWGKKNQKFWQQQTGSTQWTYRRRTLARTISTAVNSSGPWIDDYCVRRWIYSRLELWNGSDNYYLFGRGKILWFLFHTLSFLRFWLILYYS